MLGKYYIIFEAYRFFANQNFSDAIGGQVAVYVTSAYEYILKVPCGNYKLKPIRGMPNLLEGWDPLVYYWLDNWNASAGSRMDVSRRHRVQAGSADHSVSYPEGIIGHIPVSNTCCLPGV
jgi:hypothetical protein